MKLINVFIVFIISVGPGFSQSQVQKSTNYLSNINSHDLSKLWHTSIDKKNLNKLDITVPEPLGFIGTNFQRFYIHYSTITKNKTNPGQYNVTGKTKVKNSVCSFTGSITIVKAGIFTAQFNYRYKQGFVECQVALNEDTAQASAGFFKGKMATRFYLDEKSAIQYDDLLFGADLYFNNQCEANWTSYTTHKSKKVNWGDYRIPGNTGFDIGDGEFMIDDKYVENGWQNYKAARSDDPENAATIKAEQADAVEWWK